MRNQGIGARRLERGAAIRKAGPKAAALFGSSSICGNRDDMYS